MKRTLALSGLFLTLSAPLFAQGILPLIAPNAVTAPKIANASVTLAKLAPSVGVVPPGYRIIGDTSRL